MGPNRDSLLSLKSDIEELISLTKESLQSLEENNTEDKSENEDSDDKMEDPLDKEYALFKVGLIRVLPDISLLHLSFSHD